MFHESFSNLLLNIDVYVRHKIDMYTEKSNFLGSVSAIHSLNNDIRSVGLQPENNR